MSVKSPGLRHQTRPGLQAWLENRHSALETATIKAMLTIKPGQTPVSLEARVGRDSSMRVRPRKEPSKGRCRLWRAKLRKACNLQPTWPSRQPPGEANASGAYDHCRLTLVAACAARKGHHAGGRP